MTSKSDSRTLLPLIEIAVSVGIFAVAAVLTLQIFLFARFLGYKTYDTAVALFEIQNVAETVKLFSTEADAENFITVELERISDEDYAVLYYDSDWNRTDKSEAAFVMQVNIEKTFRNGGYLYEFNLDMYRIEAYPFIDNKRLLNDADYIPLLASLTAARFVYN